MHELLFCEKPPRQSLATSGRLPCRPQPPLLRQLLTLALATAVLCSLFQLEDAEGKRRKKRRVEPPLRILSINLSPETYVVGTGTLDFDIEVAIPPGTDGSTILEVSSLISSRSKRHLRFLATRMPVGSQGDAASDRDAESADPTESAPPTDTTAAPPARITVTLTWDGTDQNREPVAEGRYNYEIRAKLLAMKENGPRTQMLSWKKKGMLHVAAEEE
jgi:hypothetical protein